MENNEIVDNLKKDLKVYESFLQFHTNSSDFLKNLIDNCDVFVLQGFGKALVKIYENKSEFPNWKDYLYGLLELFKKKEESEELLKVLETDLYLLLLINPDEAKTFFDANYFEDFDKKLEDLGSNFLKITSAAIRTFKNTDHLKDLKNLREKIVNEMFLKETYHKELIFLVSLLVSDTNLSQEVLETILSKTIASSNELAFKNLTYFFETMCKKKLIKNHTNLLEKALKNKDPVCRKQGIYFIKCLLSTKTIPETEEENWRKFIIVSENLEESQSHLILPTLNLVDEITFEDKVWVQTLLQTILSHDNTQVSNWGVKKVLQNKNLVDPAKEKRFNDEFVLTFLRTINKTFLFGSNEYERIINVELLHKFVEENFESVMKNVEEILWTSVPYYYLVQGIQKAILNLKTEELTNQLLKQLENQLKFISKKLQNLQIRAGVQIIYSEILNSLLRQESYLFKDVLEIVYLIFEFSDCESVESQLYIFLGQVPGIDFENLGLETYPLNFQKFVYVGLMMRKQCDTNVFPILASKEISKYKICLEILKDPLNWRTDLYRVKYHEFLMEFQKSHTPEDNLENFELLDNTLDKDLTSMKFSKFLKNQAETADDATKLYIHHILLKFYSNDDSDLFLKAFDVAKVCEGKKAPQLIEVYLKLLKIIWDQGSGVKKKEIFQEASVIVERGNSTTLNLLMEILEIALSDGENDGIALREKDFAEVQEIFKRIYKEVMEIRDFREFADCYESFCGLILPKNQEILHDNWKQEVVYFFEEIMKNSGTYKSLLVFTFYKRYFRAYCNFRGNVSREIILQGFLYGDNLTREQKIESYVGREICNSHQDINKRYFIPDAQLVRMATAIFCTGDVHLLKEMIIKDLIPKFLEITIKKPRYFLNSEHHRLKFRCLQPLLFLGANIPSDLPQILLHAILIQNNQQSVTYLLEIFLAHYCSLGSSIFTKVLRELSSDNIRPQAAQSLISVIYLAYQSNTAIFRKDLKYIVQAVFPHAMGQNFASRIHAQYVVYELMKHIDDKRINSFKFGMAKLLNYENSKKMLDTLKHLSYDFVLDELMVFESIYCHIPRVTNMTSDEICDHKIFEDEIQTRSKFSPLPFETADKFGKFKQNYEKNIVSDEIEVTPSFGGVNSTNLQQKYQLSFKQMIPDEKILVELPNVFPRSLKDKTSNSELIVVASLVSRPPNLGGLARTGEVFGIQEYVIDSLNHVKNSEFIALSKSAEKWLKITEIKSWQLFDYLLHKKNEGFTIIGAEQTANSKNIISTTIPKKSILLLGHEKEGIPANLLSLLDITIEIPQTGVVRSLNVHVSGALVMWEYARQHIFQKTRN